jgi:hypothetical protein
MVFTRNILLCDAMNPDPIALCAHLIPGGWMIEADSYPPASHDPARLPLGDSVASAFAFSLTSATAIRLGLGPALVDRLASLGPCVGPLAALALHELIVNAVIHGNLQVASGRSGQWQDIDKRQTLIAQSLADPQRAARVVTVAVGWGSGQVVAVIADEGSGYDTTAASLPRLGAGRGLRLARMVGHVDVLCGGSQTAITIDCASANNGERP